MPGPNVLTYEEMVKKFGEFPDPIPTVVMNPIDLKELNKKFDEELTNIKENLHVPQGEAYIIDPSF